MEHEACRNIYYLTDRDGEESMYSRLLRGKVDSDLKIKEQEKRIRELENKAVDK